MCDTSATKAEVRAARPRAPRTAVDPIGLRPVDEVVVTTLVDNVYDALLPGDDRVSRAPFKARPELRSSRGRAPRWASRLSTASLRWSPFATEHVLHAALRHRALTRRHGDQRGPSRGRPLGHPGRRPQPRALRPRRRTCRARNQTQAAGAVGRVLHSLEQSVRALRRTQI